MFELPFFSTFLLFSSFMFSPLLWVSCVWSHDSMYVMLYRAFYFPLHRRRAQPKSRGDPLLHVESSRLTWFRRPVRMDGGFSGHAHLGGNPGVDYLCQLTWEHRLIKRDVQVVNGEPIWSPVTEYPRLAHHSWFQSLKLQNWTSLTNHKGSVCLLYTVYR